MGEGRVDEVNNMDEIIVLENVCSDGVCSLHLMSNSELTADVLPKYNAPVDVKFEVKKEAGAYHLRASWLVHGMLTVVAEGWPIPKLFVVWNLAGCKSITDAVRGAADQYQDIFGERPVHAFIDRLPREIGSGVEIGDLMLFESPWMMRKCVAVGWLYK